MKIGILNQNWSSPDISDREYLKVLLEDAQLAEELGYDSLWYGEHHFGRKSAFYPRIPNLDILLGRLAGVTSTIQIGTGIKQLAGYLPSQAVTKSDASSGAAKLVEDLMMVYLVTDGRAVFGLGSGMTYTDTGAVSPVAPADHTERFQRLLIELAAFLDNPDRPDLPPVTPTPLAELRERIWVGSRTAATIELAVGLGFKLIMGQAENAVKQSEYVRTYRAAGGRQPVRGIRLLHVAETDRQARSEVEDAALRYYQRMSAARGIVTPGVTIPGAPAATAQRPASLTEVLDSMGYLVGSPETVATALDQFRAEVGADRVDVLMQVPGVSHDAVRRSMRLLAQDVAPNLAYAA